MIAISVAMAVGFRGVDRASRANRRDEVGVLLHERVAPLAFVLVDHASPSDRG